jgi:hypothetical protein
MHMNEINQKYLGLSLENEALGKEVHSMNIFKNNLKACFSTELYKLQKSHEDYLKLLQLEFFEKMAKKDLEIINLKSIIDEKRFNLNKN